MKVSLRTAALAAALVVLPSFADDTPTTPANITISASILIGRYHSGVFAQGAAEIVAYDPQTQRLFVINAADVTVDVLDMQNPASPQKIGFLDARALGGSANSVAVKNGVVAVAIEAVDKQANGVVAFYDAVSLTFLNQVAAGALPDMLTFTPDGTKVLVANEGEPNASYTNDPEGSITLIDISQGVERAAAVQLHFRDFNTRRQKLLNNGVRLFGPGATVAQDLEPEYIAISENGKRAWVSLQENNAFAVLDIKNQQIVEIWPLGVKDHSLPGNELDASDRDNRINIQNWPVFGLYLPDSLASYSFGGRNYIVSANEGDLREYAAFVEEARISTLTLDPVAFPNASVLRNAANLGRLKVTRTLGDANGDGLYEKLYTIGTRSFSIWRDDGTLVFDSGATFERVIAERLPLFFDSDHEGNNFDNRSDDKGPEPEAVAIGRIQGRTYAFIGLERVGGIMIYDITDPYHASFVDYVNSRDFTAPTCLDTNGVAGCDASNPAAGDLGPESITFVPADQSPNQQPLLVLGNEISGTTSIYQINVIQQ